MVFKKKKKNLTVCNTYKATNYTQLEHFLLNEKSFFKMQKNPIYPTLAEFRKSLSNKTPDHLIRLII